MFSWSHIKDAQHLWKNFWTPRELLGICWRTAININSIWLNTKHRNVYPAHTKTIVSWGPPNLLWERISLNSTKKPRGLQSELIWLACFIRFLIFFQFKTCMSKSFVLKYLSGRLRVRSSVLNYETVPGFLYCTVFYTCQYTWLMQNRTSTHRSL